MSFEANSKVILSRGDLTELLRLIQLRHMVSHRQFTVKELAKASKRTLYYVTKHLSGWTLLNGSKQSFENGQLLLDDTISKLTKARGYMCKCSKHEHKEIERTILYG